LATLRPRVNAANYNTWLKDTQGVLCRDHVFMLRVPNASVAQYLDTKLRSLIEKTIIDVTLVECKIAFKAGEDSYKLQAASYKPEGDEDG
jgi:chromosomal replication initiation ATPase DnaA